MNVPIRAVSICVDYSDIASLTIPYNRQHFAEHWIVTTPEDERTQEVARKHGCQLFLTREFFHKGAEFAKWRALETALDHIGRHGWILLLDADICWPKCATEAIRDWSDYKGDHPRTGCLYCPKRWMLDDLSTLSTKGIPPENIWTSLRFDPNPGEWAGYSLLLNASDPHLPPGHWHDTNWRSCAGADSFLQMKWSGDRKIRLPFEVLHLGSPGENWYGRATPFLDGREAPVEAEERKRKVQNLPAERAKAGFKSERIE